MDTPQQYNVMSGDFYQGVHNWAALLAAKEAGGFASNGWITFLQAKQKGLKIKKGSHGVRIFKGFAEFEKDEKDIKKGGKRTYSAPLGGATVFNLDQTEEMEVGYTPTLAGDTVIMQSKQSTLTY
jgi:antirestriction protein ArdC